MTQILNLNTALYRYWQRDQNTHDHSFHRDIVSGSPKERLTHAALHFNKYLGRFGREGTAPSDNARKTVTDMALIALGAANVRDVHLMTATPPSFEPLGHNSVLNNLCDCTGRYADYLEKLEHMERDAPDLDTAIVDIFTWILAAAHFYNIDLDTAIEARRAEIRDSRKFLGVRAIA